MNDVRARVDFDHRRGSGRDIIIGDFVYQSMVGGQHSLPYCSTYNKAVRVELCSLYVDSHGTFRIWDVNFDHVQFRFIYPVLPATTQVSGNITGHSRSWLDI
jgi:hypothetical protein